MSGSPYSSVALRRGAWYFLTGKAASAVMTFSILIWVVRLLPIPEYGVYVTLVAGMELAIAISGLGIPWLAARYLPEYRLHAPGQSIRRLVQRLLTWLTASLVFCTGLLAAGLEHYLSWAGVTAYREAATLYLLVLMAEGIGRSVIVSLLDPLMQQHVVRASSVIRQFTFILLLFLASSVGSVQLIDVVRAELVASVLGAAVGLTGVWRYLATLTSSTGLSDWHEPKLREMWRTGLHMYAAYLFTLIYSPQIYLVFILHILGEEAAATFGFLRSLYQQIAAYLPATLLFGLIRPKLMASFVSGGMAELARNANMAGKLSLFVLMPLIVFAGAAGAELIDWLSGARFPDTGLLFLGFMLVLVPFSQRLLTESVAVAAGYSALCPRAAASGLLTLPLMMGLLHLELGLWAPVIAMGVGHLLFNVIILVAITRCAGYRPDQAGLYKLFAAAVISYLGAALLPPLSPLWFAVLADALFAVTVFLLIAWLIKPFAEIERKRINYVIKRPFFIW